MPRKRTELGSEIEAQIRVRTERGESAETIAQALGRPVSTATIKRRQQELRGKAAPKAVAGPPARPGEAAPASPPGLAQPDGEDVPDEVPEGTPVQDLDRWIKRCDVIARRAEAAGNFGTFASIAQKVAAMMALRHRVAPLPKADPNDNPDMKALAAKGRATLAKLAHAVYSP